LTKQVTINSQESPSHGMTSLVIGYVILNNIIIMINELQTDYSLGSIPTFA